MGRRFGKDGKLFLCITTLIGVILTGCSLLPVEEVRPSPVVHSMERVTYAFETVKREDLVKSKYIYCTYEQRKDESLSFGIGDKVVCKVNVEIGSQVKQGDLLAELDMGSLDEDIENISDRIELNTLKLKHTKRIMELYIEKETDLYHSGSLTQKEYEKNVEAILERYEKSIQEYEDALYIDNLVLTSYLEERKKSRIYAGMDGIVTYIKTGLLGSAAKKDEAVIKIIDNTECAFRAETEYASYFEEGEVVDIVMRLDGGTVFKAIAAHDKDNPKVIYFELAEPTFQLNVGDRGTITLILEERKNVLTISARALNKAEDFYYVYYVNEDGIRSMKEVTIGMTGTNSVEITSGLSYGDIVITR